MKAIELTGVRKHFRSPSGEVRAVAGIDLEIDRGEVVAFLGRNGAGKTTTIDMILGLTQPTSGRVAVLGGTARQAVLKGAVGALLQTGGLLNDLTVLETIQIIASIQGSQDRVDRAIAEANLEHLQKRRVSRCSGGEQQRIKFALALLTDPELLILDEPTAGLDVNARRDFWDAMHAHARDGRTVLFATHLMEEADNFAHRIVVIDQGQVIADGATGEIRAMTNRRRVSAVLPETGAAELMVELGALLGDDHAVEGRRLSATVADSDALALALLRRGCRDLEVTTPSLEEAFVALTTEGETR
ncbi:MAG: ABC transporter ATP-binding protein [Propionibacteriaceae bacterium]|nr:ABC transporter ATP-binding protein [Propionibacteriaceae bacterium]